MTSRLRIIWSQSWRHQPTLELWSDLFPYLNKVRNPLIIFYYNLIDGWNRFWLFIPCHGLLSKLQVYSISVSIFTSDKELPSNFPCNSATCSVVCKRLSLITTLMEKREGYSHRLWYVRLLPETYFIKVTYIYFIVAL